MTFLRTYDTCTSSEWLKPFDGDELKWTMKSMPRQPFPIADPLTNQDDMLPVVLIIATAFPPDPLTGADRPARFAKFLPTFGYEPLVICQELPGLTNEVPGVLRVPRSFSRRRTRFLSRIDSVAQRYLSPYDDQIPWVRHALDQAREILAVQPVVAVISTSPPIATHLVARKLKQRFGIPWLADFRDPLLGNPFRARRWFFSYDALVESLLFRSADVLVANTDTVADMWKQRYPQYSEKISVLWNGFDPDDRIVMEDMATTDQRVLAHVGTLYGGRHPGKLLSSLVRLINQGSLAADRIYVRLVGDVDENCLRTNREQMEILRSWKCLECDGKSIPRNEARRVGLQADYLLLLDMNDKNTDLQVPAKVFEYIRFGRPILAFTRRDSPTERILQGSGVPSRIVYPDASDAEVDEAVRGLFDIPVDRMRPSEWFEKNFNGRNQVQRLAEILDSVRGIKAR